ncbi:hypothetical protein GCM10009541_31440 [Micromonospora gifhornensis]|uniref:Uncharacterized protein n=1 Tax=Micromonospora gifhornensis TaxID=84594 RepID=A0ABQ4IM02_9ACTN|nr:hypothetical protein C1A38_03655 [Verrucosispora sp. ts21]GIJ18934.1 hypothetical protein Vgi01_56180 [Micromonospora gifhornensis]
MALTGVAATVYGVASASENDTPTPSVVAVEAPAAAVPVAGARPPGAGTGKPQPTPSVDAVLSGTRRITIVRVGAFESGLSLLDGGRLAEVDGAEGRQVFVPTPLGAGEYLIKAYYGGGTGKPICWQSHNPQNTQPLYVRGATCRANDPAQRFVITAAEGGGPREYVISNRWAYLRDSVRSGLILEELGDAAPFSSFRFNDTGPAPRK